MKKIVVLLLTVLIIVSSGIQTFAKSFDSPYRISCTVNGETSSQRGFCWYTQSDCDTKIRLFKDGTDITDSVTVSAVKCEKWKENYMHKLLVSGLDAGTTYTYLVGDGQNWSDEGTFTTDNKDNEVSFLTFADVQASSAENFQAAAETVKTGLDSLGNKADFMLNLGDFTNDSTNEEWDYYADSFDSVDMNGTLVPVAENHDGLGKYHWFANMFNLDESESVQTLNGVNYSFDYGNIHIAVLNTNDLLAVSDAQLKWLKNDMNSSSATWKIVAMHKSPYTLGKDGKWPDACYLRNSVTKVCDECNVDLILSGHDHQYLRTKALENDKVSEDGSVYVLCGTSGTKRYSVRPFMVENFISTSQIETMVSQNDGYYFNGIDFNSQNDDYQGSCFNTVKINGGTLQFESYVVSEGKTTEIDSFTLSKDDASISSNDTNNAVSAGTNFISFFTSIFKLFNYTIFRWLPKFVGAAPEIIKSVSENDVF